MIPRRSRTVLVGLALAIAASAPATARADATPEQMAAAQALFNDARKLITEKRYAEACPKLEESQHLDPGVGTLLYLADCQQRTGKTASAWANFLEAAYRAKREGETKREMTARSHAAALEPKLSRLTILAVVAGTQLEIKRDGEAVTTSLLGTAVPVDPGDHTVSASAPGKKPWKSTVTVRPDGHQATVSVPQLEDDGAQPSTPPAPPPHVEPPPQVAPPQVVEPPPPPPSVPPPEPRQPVGPPADVSTGRGPRAAGVVFTVLGAGGLGAGAAFAVMAKQKYDASLSGGCTGNACNAAGTVLRNDARAYGNYATAGIVGGGVLAAGGVGMLIAASVIKSRSDGTQPAVTATVDPRGGGMLGLKGSF